MSNTTTAITTRLNLSRLTPATQRTALLALIAAALIAGYLATSPAATNLAITHDGAALTRLMRFMAAIKALIAITAAAAILWRLSAPISLPWFTAYAAASAAMAAGPGLIWNMAHIGLGALLLHGGLLATLILLWQDPATSTRLAELVAIRRARS